MKVLHIASASVLLLACAGDDSAGSTSTAGIDRRAPAEQRARMERYRGWFHERRFPARGSKAP